MVTVGVNCVVTEGASAIARLMKDGKAKLSAKAKGKDFVVEAVVFIAPVEVVEGEASDGIEEGRKGLNKSGVGRLFELFKLVILTMLVEEA